MKEIRVKATVAARHSERTVGGLCQVIAAQKITAKAEKDALQRMEEICHRLGSLEEAQRRLLTRLPSNGPRARGRVQARTLITLAGAVLGTLVFGVFFWN